MAGRKGRGISYCLGASNIGFVALALLITLEIHWECY
jgi:hypothetical protein